MDIETKNTDWSDSELAAAVDTYLKMLELEQNGQKFNKALENRLLRQGKLAERTEGSVEFRMLNISTVLERMGRKRINGYKSAPHVGSNVENSIRFGVWLIEGFWPLTNSPLQPMKKRSNDELPHFRSKRLKHPQRAF